MTKYLMLAGVALAALATPAAARQIPVSEVFGNSRNVLLACPAGAPSRTDRDPIATTYVHLVVNSDFAPTILEVTHAMRSGEKHSRSDQYNIYQVGKNKENLWGWAWFGELYKNQTIDMMGTVNYANDGYWWYQETLYKNHYQDEVLPSVRCHIVNGNVEDNYTNERL